MIYTTPDQWRSCPNKRVLFFGMSGLGKTHLSNILRAADEGWFHYSIDYRIGTAYMGEFIQDNLKREAMKVPFLRDLIRSDSIYIGSNITFDNLAPLASYLGKPGNPDLGGLSYAEYCHRQELHHRAERNALLDTHHFIKRAGELYGYDHFVCDTGGSICEVVDPDDPDDEILAHLNDHTLMIWIEGTPDHTDTLIKRFSADPKPMCYRPAFLDHLWQAYLRENAVTEREVDPNAFIRFTYARAIEARQSRYAAMARNWGLKVQAADVAQVRDANDVNDLVADALGNGRPGS
jgi:hypothetical protein